MYKLTHLTPPSLSTFARMVHCLVIESIKLSGLDKLKIFHCKEEEVNRLITVSDNHLILLSNKVVSSLRGCERSRGTADSFRTIQWAEQYTCISLQQEIYSSLHGQELMLTLIKLRLNPSVEELTYMYQFGISLPTVSRLFHKWLEWVWHSTDS